MAEKNKKELTPLEKQQKEIKNKILDYKLICEANVVATLYKYPEEMCNYNLTLTDFHNNMWRVYFQIASDIILLEKKKTLDEMTVGLYLEKHPKLKKEYEKYDGYANIANSNEYLYVENLEGYVLEMRKWGAVFTLFTKGFPVTDEMLSKFNDMTTEDIYQFYEISLNETFANADSDTKAYNFSNGVFELINELNDGKALGLEYYDMPLLTKETGGQYEGSITLLGAISNAGKSALARLTTIPSIIKNNEKLVIMVNEDSVAKWQREMLVWICNNILKYDMQKYVVRNGMYTEEVESKLNEAAKWLDEKVKQNIIIIPFMQYRTSNAIKQIRKFANLGVKYFILDTFKMDAGVSANNSWIQMQQSMVDIKDVVKAEALNVHILITFQLEKGSSTMRYYTQNNIGMAKNIVDVASTCIMLRDLYNDEYEGQKAIKVYKWIGKNESSKVEVKLDKEKKYQLLFIVKNQEGAANDYQIVIEHDKSRNIIKEIGMTKLLPDGF